MKGSIQEPLLNHAETGADKEPPKSASEKITRTYITGAVGACCGGAPLATTAILVGPAVGCTTVGTGIWATACCLYGGAAGAVAGLLIGYCCNREG